MKDQRPLIAILGISALLTIPGFLKPSFAAPAETSKPAVPEFKGEIGHFAKGKSFEKFIFDHQLKPIYIDAYMTPGPLDEESSFKIINDTFGLEYFVLWDSCEPALKAGEKPSNGACTGTEISLDRSEGPKDADLRFYRGALTLKGYFVIKGCDGPHQGLMGCTLRPVNAEAVLR